MENYNRTKKVEYQGELYDSQDEVHYLKYLQRLKAEGKILNYERGEKTILQPTFKFCGKTILAITYTPDFVVYHLDGTTEIVEVKGFMKEDAALKLKLFKYQLKDTNTRLTVLTRNLKWGGESGFIEYDELKRIRAKNRKVKGGG